MEEVGALEPGESAPMALAESNILIQASPTSPIKSSFEARRKSRSTIRHRLGNSLLQPTTIPYGLHLAVKHNVRKLSPKLSSVRLPKGNIALNVYTVPKINENTWQTSGPTRRNDQQRKSQHHYPGYGLPHKAEGSYNLQQYASMMEMKQTNSHKAIGAGEYNSMPKMAKIKNISRVA